MKIVYRYMYLWKRSGCVPIFTAENLQGMWHTL